MGKDGSEKRMERSGMVGEVVGEEGEEEEVERCGEWEWECEWEWEGRN